jgi:hypothetical protein
LIPVKTIRQIQGGLKLLLSYVVFAFPVIAFMLVGALIYGLFFNTAALKSTGEWMTKDSRGIFIVGVSTISGLLLAISQEVRLKLEKPESLVNKQNIWNLQIYRDVPNGCKAGLHQYLRHVADKLEAVDLINSNVIGSRDFFDYQKLDGYITISQFMNIYLNHLDVLPMEYREVVMNKFHEISYEKDAKSYLLYIQKTQVWWFFHQILAGMSIVDSPQSIDLVVKSIIFDQVGIGPSRIDPFQPIEIIKTCRLTRAGLKILCLDLMEFVAITQSDKFLDKINLVDQCNDRLLIEFILEVYAEFFNSKEK